MPGIVVGIDGSTHSRRVLDWAISEAGIRHAPLTVLTVHPSPRGFWNDSIEYPADPALMVAVRKTVQEETDDALAKFAEDARPPQVTVQAVEGLPAERLLRAGADADMIVLGSRGAGGFAKLLLGSVASQVTHHAHCPVVVVPTEAS